MDLRAPLIAGDQQDDKQPQDEKQQEQQAQHYADIPPLAVPEHLVQVEESKYVAPPRYADLYPGRARVIEATDRNILENVLVPGTLALALYATNKLKTLQGNNNENDILEYLAIGATVVWAVTHLIRSASRAISGFSEYKEALIRNEVATRDQMVEMESRLVHKGAQFFSGVTAGAVVAASVCFAKEQYEYGTLASVISLVTYIFNSLLRRKEGEANYLIITEDEFVASMSPAQKIALTAGGGIALMGAVSLIFTNYLVQRELNNGGTNPHRLATLATEAVTLAGFAILGTYSSLRGADATKAAIESKLENVSNNQSTLFGKFPARRDLVNLGSAALNTTLLSSLSIAFALGQDTSLKYIPALLCAIGLVVSIKLTTGQHANDLQAITHKLDEQGAQRRPRA